jgi:hypothetical protein
MNELRVLVEGPGTPRRELPKARLPIRVGNTTIFAVTAFCAASITFPLSAQTNTAGIAGAITDESGGVVRRVELAIENQDTGAKRITHTDDAGRYNFEQLLPGRYRLTAQLAGFQTEVVTGVQLTIGTKAVLDLHLKVGTVKTETLVAAAAELVDTRDSSLSSVMENTAIRELPLNGRDVAQLALLQPGVAPSLRSGDSGGAGTNLVIEGSRPDQISFLLDGSDINDGNNATPGSAAGVVLGIDTLQEFRVLTNAYSAEYGRSAGGVVSAVTKSGTNALHGSLFEFLRNSDLDSKNYFDVQTAPIPAFKRNQYGVEVDGPIFQDKTFFLGSFEQLRQRLGVTTISVVPDANARIGIIPGLPRVNVNPAVPAYLELVPLPNARNFGDGTGQFITSASQPTDDTFFAGRLDHRVSDATSLFARFTYDTAVNSKPDGYNLVSAASQTLNHYLTVGGTHIFNERLVDTFRVSDNRSYAASTVSFLQPVSSALSLVPGAPLGSISVSGGLNLGPSRFSPTFSTLSLYQFSDDLAWSKGRHSLKVGGDYRFYINPKTGGQSQYGYYQFTSLVNFLIANPSTVTFSLPGSILSRRWRQSMTSFYLQDDIRLSRRLTMNIGVRYERESVPVEAKGLSAVIRNPISDATGTIGPPFVNPTNLGFAPRAGLAWDPFGDGRTSVRAGFGLFYNPLWNDAYNSAGGAPPFYVLGSVSNPVFPNAYLLIGSQPFVLGSLSASQYRPNYPYVLQSNFTIQRQLGREGVLTAGYAGSRGIHIPRLVDFNESPQTILPDGRVFFPVGSTVQNPNFGGLRYTTTNGMSYYNALQISFQQRFSRGLLFRVNYTFSKNIDTDSLLITPGNTNDLPQNPLSLKAERGLSNYDMRNNLVTYLVWSLPAAPGPKVLTHGWQLNWITTVASGQPFGVTLSYDRARANPGVQSTGTERPDLCPGASTNPILGGPTRYFNPGAFCLQAPGFFGNLGRNTLIGPGLVMVNPALAKQFTLTERVRVQFRVEFFNALNHPNFAIPSARTVFNNSGAVGSAGLITATTTSSRQVQFGLKLTF